MIIMPNKTALEMTCDPTTNGKWISNESDLSSLLECTDPEPIVPHYDDFENHQRRIFPGIPPWGSKLSNMG